MKRFFRIAANIIFYLLLVLLLSWVFIQTAPVQQQLKQVAISRLNKLVNGTIEIDEVQVSLLNRITLKGIRLKDTENDTLAAAAKLTLAITDWFPFKDSATIRYLAVEDGLIKLQRFDSVWNNHNLFAADKAAADTSKPAVTLGSTIKIALEQVLVKGFRFEKLDHWRGKFIYSSLAKLEVKGTGKVWQGKTIDLQNIFLLKPSYREFKQKGLWSAADSAAYWRRIDSLDALPVVAAIPDEDPWIVQAKTIKIEDGDLRFFNRRKQPSTPGIFDDRDIIITQLNGTVNNFELKRDTIRALAQVTANERSGFKIKKLRTAFTMHPQLMEFSDLDVQTNNSRLGPYYAMRYKKFDHMEYFIDSVQIESVLNQSVVSVEDIAVFAPTLKGIWQKGTLSGQAQGCVSEFTVKNLLLKIGRSSIAGTYAMKGLTDIEKTQINFTTASSTIELKYLEPWVPALADLQQTPVRNLDLIRFSGSFTGTPYDFSTKGNFTTGPGSFIASLQLKLNGPKRGFRSEIKQAIFDGGRLLNIPRLGYLNFDGEVKSRGFSLKDTVFITGRFSEFAYNDYNYRNIATATYVVNNQLNSALAINDSNLIGEIVTTLDFNTLKQRYNAQGTVTHANLLGLGISRDSLSFQGDFDVDFTGNNLDDFNGYARFYNASLQGSNTPINFDSLQVLAHKDEATGQKTLELTTNEAYARVQGIFSLSGLPASFSFFLNRYYPNLIKAPDSLPAQQDFAFELRTGRFEPFLKIFDQQFSGLNKSSFTGSLNTINNQLDAQLYVPAFGYGQSGVKEVRLSSMGSLENLSIAGTVGNLQLNEKIGLPNGELLINTQKDSTRLQLKTTTLGPLGNAAIDAAIFSKEDGVLVRFNPSSFIASNKKWVIENQGEIEWRKQYLISNGIRLTADSQQINLYTLPSDEGNWNDVHINLKQLNLGDILPYLFTDPVLEGAANGNFVIIDPLGEPVLKPSLTISDFSFNGEKIGLINLSGKYNHQLRLLNALVISPNKDYDFEGEVTINLQHPGNYTIGASIDLRNERLTILRKYLDGLLDEVDGFATGTLQLSGKLEAPALTGTLQLKQGSLLVNYTQCRYFIDTAKVVLGNNFIDFGNLQVRDGKGRKGSVEGRFYHRFFDSLYFNLKMRTEGMEVLNTTARDNGLFHGKAVGKGSFDLSGPLSNLQMLIAATPTDSSFIAITNKSSKTSGEADYIVFKQYGTEKVQTIDSNRLNMHIQMELIANPLCRIDVVLDELTGDIISATGNANLSIRTGTVEPTIIRGRYVVEKGSYNYTFQSFIRKPFLLKGEGASFIEWNGDPYDAYMNVLARYVAREVSLRDLISAEGSNVVLDQAARNYKGDVYVNALLRGSLNRPNIDFDIEFPQGSVMRNNISALDMLRRIREDESEKLRQVTYLIVFRAFAPYRQGAGQRSVGADLAVNTISELVSREMGKILTGVIHDLTRDKSLSVDLSTNFYNSSQSLGNVNIFNQYDRVNVNFNLNKSYFNNRVVVNLGSDFDLNVRNTTTTGFQFLPDVSVEFILTPNRRLRAILFKRDNLDIVGRRNRAGASISYRIDFDQLFNRKTPDSLLFIRKDDESLPTSGKEEQ